MDLRPFLRDETGIGVYYRSLLSALAEIDRDNHYCLFSASWKDRFREERLPPFASRTLRDAAWPTRLVDFAWSRLGRPFLDTLFDGRLDLTHSPTPLILPTRGRSIVTAHDLFFLDQPGLTDSHTRRIFRRRAPRSLRRADGVIAVSRHVARILMEKLDVEESRIRVIHHGIDPVFRRAVPRERLEEIRDRYELPQSFLLFVGAGEPRKNLPRLVRSLRYLPESAGPVPLVLVGKKGSDHARIRDAAVREGVSGRVRWLDYCPVSDLIAIYRAATALVMPSLCEGFGLPVLEAMAGGLPVAAARVSALPEIAGEAALFFDPLDSKDMARCIGSLLEDEALRRRMGAAGIRRSRGFDWIRTARKTLAFYRDVGGGGG